MNIRLLIRFSPASVPKNNGAGGPRPVQATGRSGVVAMPVIMFPRTMEPLLLAGSIHGVFRPARKRPIVQGDALHIYTYDRIPTRDVRKIAEYKCEWIVPARVYRSTVCFWNEPPNHGRPDKRSWQDALGVTWPEFQSEFLKRYTHGQQLTFIKFKLPEGVEL